MVYKIVGDFSGDNFKKIASKIIPLFKFIYIKNVLYIAPLNYKTWLDNQENINKIFKSVPLKKCFIHKIDETNIMRESKEGIQWCRDNLVSLDKERYELENQEYLKEKWKAFDRMEEILQEELKKQVQEFKNKSKINKDLDEELKDDLKKDSE